MGNSNDGKYFEDFIEKELKKIKEPGFRYRRLHDAHAARNFFVKQPADFFLAFNGVCCHLECKTTASKTWRLEKFSQLPEMQMWERAGVIGLVAVHFYIPDVLKFEFTSKLNPEVSSYLMKDLPSYNMDTLIPAIMEVLKW